MPDPLFVPPPTKKIKLSGEKKARESTIEDANRKDASKVGAIFEKFSSPNKRSVPDRMLTFKCGLIVFIEYKRPGEHATELQFKDHEKRRARRVLVYVVDNKQSGRDLINRLADLDQLDYEAYRAEWEANRAKYINKFIVE